MSGHEAKPSEREVIDGNEAARLLSIHPVTLAEMAREGRIPAFKVGRVWRYRRSSLQRWMDEQEQRQQEQKSA
jgi:PTS system nitrogen regulatory IIA component